MFLAALLTAACGGERQAESGTAGAPADTAVVAPADTGTASMTDTAAPAPDTAPAAVADTANPPTQTARAEPAPKPAPAPAPKAATEPKPAPKPAPAPAATDTQATQDTQPAAPTAPAEPAPAKPAEAAETPAVEPLRDEYHQAPRDTVTQVVYDGWKQYNLNCARCHGEDVLGTTIAPHLIVSMKPDGPINTQESFVQVVCAGRPDKGMPAWCSLGLEMDKINAIYSYVKGRSAGEIGPGRPALKEGG